MFLLGDFVFVCPSHTNIYPMWMGRALTNVQLINMDIFKFNIEDLAKEKIRKFKPRMLKRSLE